jgi:hypothetical protein
MGGLEEGIVERSQSSLNVGDEKERTQVERPWAVEPIGVSCVLMDVIEGREEA